MNSYEQKQAGMPVTRKIGMDEMREIIGALTTPYEEATASERDIFNAQRAEEERVARESLTAYYVGRMRGVVNVVNPVTDANEVLRYKELVDQHTLQMLARYDAEAAAGADIIEVDFGQRTHYDEIA